MMVKPVRKRHAAQDDLPAEATNCVIGMSALVFDINDPNYPHELHFNEFGRPACSAFSDIDDDQQPPVIRCQNTLELPL